MYEEFYGLSGCPFRLTPDRKFYFGSEGHRKAMSYLKYGLYQGEGFIVVTGDVGTGKSTLISQLFADIDSTEIIAVQIGTTQIDADDAIRLICDAFSIKSKANDKASLLAAFENFLIKQNKQNRRVLLVMDEAQNLPMRTLEELRMLSNFNLSGQPLFQSFLVGQPQFLRTLAHPDLSQLQQRVIASYKLEAMSRQETGEYIQHRLVAVGWSGDPEWTEDASNIVFDETRGVPRRINTLCNRVMLYAALKELHVIDKGVIALVVNDIKSEVAKAQSPSLVEAAPQPMSGDPTLSDAASAAEALAARESANQPSASLSTTYSPHMETMELSVQMGQISARITRIESTLVEHERALQELIDVAVNFLSRSEDEEAANRRNAPHSATA